MTDGATRCLYAVLSVVFAFSALAADQDSSSQSSEDMAKWDARLLKKAAEANGKGIKPSFKLESMRSKVKLISVRNEKLVFLTQGVQFELPMSRLSISDKKGLADDLAHDAEGRALAAFYKRAAKDAAEAEAERRAALAREARMADADRKAKEPKRVTTGRVSGPVKILSLGDMHLTNQNSATYPRKVIEAMNDEGADLVLVCGDLGSKPTKAELELARDVLDELKMPYYPVLGNHDALFAGEKEETLFRKVFSLKHNSYHFAQMGIQFIGIDHGCGKAYRRNNSVRPAVMAWLEKTLATIPDDQPIIFFSHYPFGKGVKERTKNADDVHALFKGKKLLAMLGAHVHGNTERRENGVLMTTTACSSGTRGNYDGTKAKGFRVFLVDEKLDITTEFIEVKQ